MGMMGQLPCSYMHHVVQISLWMGHSTVPSPVLHEHTEHGDDGDPFDDERYTVAPTTPTPDARPSQWSRRPGL